MGRRSTWLPVERQADVVDMLLRYGLLKLDNNRSLPLKSGGKTDVYINLRDARNSPAAIRDIVRFFEIPFRQIDGLDRFVEVPDAVSCFAGPLSIALNRPYLTIRETAKAGRATDALMIGQPRHGATVAILDDVITDGESKIVPYRHCLRAGLKVDSLVVLVDRQQGWPAKFAQHNIGVDVWPGMTLHDVRRCLIQDLGVMQRCSPEVEKANPIIVALDGLSWDEILPIIDPLRTTGCILKVNDLMFDMGMEHLLPNLSVYGRVMVDLKGHDIKATLENICKRLRRYNPWAVTVHASGGPEMIKGAVETLKGTDTKVLVVTVLTSLDEEQCNAVYHRQPLEQVLALAEIAVNAGAHGIVCSPKEVKQLRAKYPGIMIVTPGVRSPGADQHDQSRVDTPRQSRDDGACHLVMGRQILKAENPVAEVQRVLQEELGIKAA